MPFRETAFPAQSVKNTFDKYLNWEKKSISSWEILIGLSDRFGPKMKKGKVRLVFEKSVWASPSCEIFISFSFMDKCLSMMSILGPLQSSFRWLGLGPSVICTTEAHALSTRHEYLSINENLTSLSSFIKVFASKNIPGDVTQTCDFLKSQCLDSDMSFVVTTFCLDPQLDPVQCPPWSQFRVNQAFVRTTQPDRVVVNGYAYNPSLVRPPSIHLLNHQKHSIK